MTDHELADRIAYGYMAVTLLAVILFIVGFAHGFGASDKVSVDPKNGVCCTNCVQSWGKFIAIVIGAPFATFVVIMIVLVSIYGQSNVIRGIKNQQSRGKDAFDSFKRENRAAYDEASVGKWIIGAGIGAFVLLGLILFFTGPKSLAGHNLAPDANQSMSACGGDYTWCQACMPSGQYLFGISLGVSLVVVMIGVGLTSAGEKKKSDVEVAVMTQ